MSEGPIMAVCPVCNKEMEEMTVEWGREKYQGWLCRNCHDKKKFNEIIGLVTKSLNVIFSEHENKLKQEAVNEV